MSYDLVPHIDGADLATQQIINVRWPIWSTHVQRWLQSSNQWDEGLFRPEHLPQLNRLLKELKRSATKTSYAEDDPKGFTARRQAYAEWEKVYLLPLAVELGLREDTLRIQIALCWRRGWFDQTTASRNMLRRPELQEIIMQMSDILPLDFAQDGISALRGATLCRDDRCATQVMKELLVVNSGAATAAWTISLAVSMYGPLGLLKFSSHPCIDEILKLQELAPTIHHLSTTPDLVVASVRADIIALCSTLQAIDDAAKQQTANQHSMVQRNKDGCVSAPKLWRPDLLHQPSHSQARQAYQQHLRPDLRALVITSLGHDRQCDEADAATLLDLWIQEGLKGIIAWRATAAHRSSRVLVMARLHAALDHHLGWLKPLYRQEIERLLSVLQQTIEALELPISLFPLVDEQPNSPYRQKIRTVLRTDKRLAAEFRERAGLAEDDASARLFAFVGYGGLGLLRFSKHEELYRIIERELVEFIHLHKVGHREGTLDLARLTPAIDAYAALLNHPPLSRQAILALTNRLPKPRNWHGGQGNETTTLHQRRVLSPQFVPEHHREPRAPAFQQRAQLHRAWMIVPIRLSLTIVDEYLAHVGQACHVLLVLDHDSALPIACWTSQRAPGTQEIGLAVYQAIWHVGHPDWPLRGIPESISVPESLMSHTEDLADIGRASGFLLTDIAAYKEERIWQRKRLVTEVRNAAADVVHAFTQQPYATCQHVQDALLAWFRRTSFATHNAAQLPTTFWQSGYTMPGYRSPAAGWLLPRMNDQVRSVRNSVMHGDMRYTSQYFTIEPGHTLFYRRFPYIYPGTEQGIFVEYNGSLHYLRPQATLD